MVEISYFMLEWKTFSYKFEVKKKIISNNNFYMLLETYLSSQTHRKSHYLDLNNSQVQHLIWIISLLCSYTKTLYISQGSSNFFVALVEKKTTNVFNITSSVSSSSMGALLVLEIWQLRWVFLLFYDWHVLSFGINQRFECCLNSF